jgi:hypothetical protein
LIEQAAMQGGLPRFHAARATASLAAPIMLDCPETTCGAG